MRTTIRLSDDFYRAVRERAHAEDTTFTAFVEDALRRRLAESDGEPTAFRVEPFDGTGLQPGVDLDDSADLLDRMGG
ncbi:CopG family transcriptional regulator [Flexivirga oryzae]|uniref:Ribbon-helix-helix protein CopG domain-containing protein n=1 Tax=Flexivirga oryzae TaxID=1794944 RepID=A0A839NCV8_9MICO|nr:CopG family transcriptional regulator [Flexivirga oryzae]MBB2894153.1 hypothetical protein [Flexivirga oryzae]